MLNIFRKRRARSTESEFLLRLSLMWITAGGLATATGVSMLAADAAIADSFGKGMAMSVAILFIGVGWLAYWWRRYRKEYDGDGIS